MMQDGTAMEPEGFLIRVIRWLVTILVISAATAIAWLISVWVMGSRIDNEVVAVMDNLFRSVSSMLAMDPIIAVFVIPFFFFSLIVVGFVLYLRYQR